MIFTAIFYLDIPMLSKRDILIPRGSISAIITYLANNHYDVNKIDKFFLLAIGKPQSGFIHIGENVLSKGDFLYALSHSKSTLKEVTLIPGETMFFFNEILAQNFPVSIKNLQKAYEKYAPYDDGVIFADTYKLPLGADADFLMQFLVQKSLKRHKELSLKVLGIYDEEQWFKYITIASIIQKEAANDKEMPLISAVIYNRIKKGMPLQMDGSLNYDKYSHQKITPDRIRQDNSTFNTYKNKGVPKSPVGSVSIQAIKAAIHPAKVDYLYFVKNKEGTHTFSKTYEEHKNHIH
ncbi:aminodeoxychorismate lyase [Helicobacter mustelae]|nr:aminodeoxychorismate lyase [Helicobacter mustelae]STP12369.1 aminodeoxychorismate lyase [Helicobacter mustelae]